MFVRQLAIAGVSLLMTQPLAMAGLVDPPNPGPEVGVPGLYFVVAAGAVYALYKFAKRIRT